MGKKCIIITSEYPYGGAEPFLEDEIEFDAHAFDNIYIFSLDAVDGEERTRIIPENVKSYPICRYNGKIKYLAYCIKGFIGNRLFDVQGNSIPEKMLSLYLLGKSYSESQIIKSNIINLIDKDDKVVVYSYWFFDHCLVACRLKKILENQGINVHVLSRGHGYDLFAERNKLGFLPFQNDMLNVIDGLYTCSLNGAEYIKKVVDEEARKKVYVARLGTLDYGSNYQDDFKLIHFVTCSSIIPLKRVDLFAKAFKIICEKYEAKWTCIGDGPKLDEVRKYIDANNLTDKVEFLGSLAHKDVIDFYKNNKVTFLTNTSYYEGVPVSIMEAQSFGIPIIASDVGGTSEIVDNDNGLLFKRDISPRELAEKIMCQLDFELIQNKQVLSRQSWEKNSSAKKVYGRWCEILLGLVKQ